MGCVSSSAANADAPRRPGDGEPGSRLVPGLQGNPNNRRVRPVGAWAWEAGAVTANQLTSKRQVFWESQTTGRRVIWDNLKVVAESMLAGNVELANTLLDAADIRVPNSDLSVCYDALGQLYQIPRYVYSNPSNLVSDEDAAALNAAARKRDHVGPAVELNVTMRIGPSAANSEQDVKLGVLSSATVREVKAALHEKLLGGTCDQAADESVKRPNIWSAKGLPPARQRIMYRGRELPENSHMQEAQVTAGAFLQVFVRPE